MRRVLSTLAILIFLPLVLCADMNLKGEALPTEVILTWNAVDGSVYYDVYLGSEFLTRIEDGKREYRVENLDSDNEYSFSVAARDGKNADLDAGFLDISTENWDGTYKWVNETDKDNKGKMRSLTLRVLTCHDAVYGQYYEIYQVPEKSAEFKIFPLFAFGDNSAGEWHKYKENSDAGRSYKENAEIFNTSIFKPGKWRVTRIEMDKDKIVAHIETSAIGIVVSTATTYEFCVDPSGNRYILLDTIADNSMVNSFLFKNPNPGEGDEFVLREID